MLEDSEAPDSELTMVVPINTADELPALATNDLDSAVEELMGEVELNAALPEFEGRNATNPDIAEATRIGIDAELSSDAISLEFEPAVALEPLDADEELDDLFVELIDE